MEVDNMTFEMSFKTAPVNKAGVFYHGVWRTDSAEVVNNHPEESINAALGAMSINAVWCVRAWLHSVRDIVRY